MEGTREELFKELDLWSTGQFPQNRAKRFYFLSGGAGLGKSVIAHQFCTLETSASKQFSLGASFFFVRGSLGSARSFFPTIAHQLAMSFGNSVEDAQALKHRSPTATGFQLASRGRRDMSSRVRDVVMSLALCHNVTPVSSDDGTVTYQASSPDEVAIDELSADP